MPRTTVDVDNAALAAAQAALGTHCLSATVNSALREVARRRALADFDVLRDVDGSPTRCSPDARPVAAPRRPNRLKPAPLTQPSLVDTAVWTWVRDRRFPELAEWFNTEVRSGRVLVCDQILLELVHLAPNEARARELAGRLSAFDAVTMPHDVGSRA